MDSETLQRENTLLRTVLDQRDQIKALEEQVDRQHSATCRFAEVISGMCMNGISYARCKNSNDFQRGQWATYSFYFERLSSVIPDLIKKYPEFEAIAIEMEDWSNELRGAAKRGE